MKGGGITKSHKYKFNKNAFDFFIKNSTRTHFNVADSRYGIISHMILNDGIISPYISTDIDNFGKYINSLLIKVVFISSVVNTIPIIEKKIMKKEDFQREVHIQEKIYNDTNKHLQPVCPAIVYSKIINNANDIEDILSRVFDINELPKMFDGIGIIAMEFAEGYTNMNNPSTPETFYIPENIKSGKYSFYARITYADGKEATADNSFEIAKKQTDKRLYYVLAGIISLAILIYLILKSKPLVEKLRIRAEVSRIVRSRKLSL